MGNTTDRCISCYPNNIFLWFEGKFPSNLVINGPQSTIINGEGGGRGGLANEPRANNHSIIDRKIGIIIIILSIDFEDVVIMPYQLRIDGHLLSWVWYPSQAPPPGYVKGIFLIIHAVAMYHTNMYLRRLLYLRQWWLPLELLCSSQLLCGIQISMALRKIRLIKKLYSE